MKCKNTRSGTAADYLKVLMHSSDAQTVAREAIFIGKKT